MLGTSEAVVKQLQALGVDCGTALSHLEAARDALMKGWALDSWSEILSAMNSALSASSANRAGLGGALGNVIALKKLVDAMVAGGESAAMGLLRDERSSYNPCLLLLSTAAWGYLRPGPRVMELDMAGSIKADGDTLICEVAEIKARKDGV